MQFRTIPLCAACVLAAGGGAYEAQTPPCKTRIMQARAQVLGLPTTLESASQHLTECTKTAAACLPSRSWSDSPGATRSGDWLTAAEEGIAGYVQYLPDARRLEPLWADELTNLEKVGRTHFEQWRDTIGAITDRAVRQQQQQLYDKAFTEFHAAREVAWRQHTEFKGWLAKAEDIERCRDSIAAARTATMLATDTRKLADEVAAKVADFGGHTQRVLGLLAAK